MLKNTLLNLAQNPRMREFVTHNRVARSAARRFVAGETLDEAIQAARVLNKDRIAAALDFLGENVSVEQEARNSVQDHIKAVDLIKSTKIDANISVKLTALGLDISTELCEENLNTILQHTNENTFFVCIDMESAPYTERTIDLTVRMHKKYEHVGTVIQSYLRRSRKDAERLILEGVRTRLVKGAYKEPLEAAYQDKRDVDRHFVDIMRLLLSRGNFPAIATHDETIINAACKYARDHGIAKSTFEFQMLYGVRRDLQERLVQQGYNMRVYLPYGSQWYPYLMRRLAERPANLMFVASNMFR